MVSTQNIWQRRSCISSYQTGIATDGLQIGPHLSQKDVLLLPVRLDRPECVLLLPPESWLVTHLSEVALVN